MVCRYREMENSGKGREVTRGHTWSWARAGSQKQWVGAQLASCYQRQLQLPKCPRLQQTKFAVRAIQVTWCQSSGSEIGGALGPLPSWLLRALPIPVVDSVQPRSSLTTEHRACSSAIMLNALWAHKQHARQGQGGACMPMMGARRRPAQPACLPLPPRQAEEGGRAHSICTHQQVVLALHVTDGTVPTASSSCGSSAAGQRTTDALPSECGPMPPSTDAQLEAASLPVAHEQEHGHLGWPSLPPTNRKHAAASRLRCRIRRLAAARQHGDAILVHPEAAWLIGLIPPLRPIAATAWRGWTPAWAPLARRLPGSSCRLCPWRRSPELCCWWC